MQASGRRHRRKGFRSEGGGWSEGEKREGRREKGAGGREKSVVGGGIGERERGGRDWRERRRGGGIGKRAYLGDGSVESEPFLRGRWGERERETLY